MFYSVFYCSTPIVPRLHWSRLMSAIAWGTQEVYLQKSVVLCTGDIHLFVRFLWLQGFKNLHDVVSHLSLCFLFSTSLFWGTVVSQEETKPRSLSNLSNKKGEDREDSHPSQLYFFHYLMKSSFILLSSLWLISWKSELLKYLFLCVWKIGFNRYNSLYWINHASYR